MKRSSCVHPCALRISRGTEKRNTFLELNVILVGYSIRPLSVIAQSMSTKKYQRSNSEALPCFFNANTWSIKDVRLLMPKLFDDVGLFDIIKSNESQSRCLFRLTAKKVRRAGGAVSAHTGTPDLFGCGTKFSSKFALPEQFAFLKKKNKELLKVF